MRKQLILACHITGVYDVNRNETLMPDDFSIVSEWVKSVERLNLQGIIFHNNFSTQTCQSFNSEHVQFVKIAHHPKFNPNVYRYFVYLNYLKQNREEIESIFITDVSDVCVLKNPFSENLFKTNSKAIFCGDEPKILENEWMLAHSSHLRSKIADYAQYESDFATATLLNCGIVGGKIEVMFPFLQKLCELHESYNFDNKTAYTGDMGAFNYLIRTQFNEVVLHGTPINTVFKAYDVENKECWFRHK